MQYDVSKDPEFISGEKTADQILEEFMSVWEGGKKEDSVTRDEFLAYYKSATSAFPASSCDLSADLCFPLVCRHFRKH